MGAYPAAPLSLPPAAGARPTREPALALVPPSVSQTAARAQVWTPEPSLSDDSEKVEEHKIISFIQMTRPIQLAVGVSLPAAAAGDGPKAAVEQWPLVQAFALQDFEAETGGGFFTQQHEVVCVGEGVRALLLRLDPPALRWLVDKEAGRLGGCLVECLGSIDEACDAGRQLKTAEADLYEPALLYDEYCRLRSAALPAVSALGLSGAAAEAARAPGVAGMRLLLGERTRVRDHGLHRTSASFT